MKNTLSIMKKVNFYDKASYSIYKKNIKTLIDG